jgi:hypothetical protein
MTKLEPKLEQNGIPAVAGYFVNYGERETSHAIHHPQQPE